MFPDSESWFVLSLILRRSLWLTCMTPGLDPPVCTLSVLVTQYVLTAIVGWLIRSIFPYAFMHGT